MTDFSKKAARILGATSLEPRIVFDAAGPVTVAEVSSDFAETLVAQPEVAAADVGVVAAALDDNEHVPSCETCNEIVFVDVGVEDAAAFISGIDPNAQIVFLDEGSDGLLQIADVLSNRTDLDAIHIISHGSEATLELGDAQLTLDTMSGKHRAALETIAAAFAPDGDLLIYGCNFGEGHDGADALSLLSALTGAAAMKRYQLRVEIWLLL